jgi:hypothetical protein
MYFSPSVADATATTTTPAHPRLPKWREEDAIVQSLIVMQDEEEPQYQKSFVDKMKKR